MIRLEWETQKDILKLKFQDQFSIINFRIQNKHRKVWFVENVKKLFIRK